MQVSDWLEELSGLTFNRFVVCVPRPSAMFLLSPFIFHELHSVFFLFVFCAALFRLFLSSLSLFLFRYRIGWRSCRPLLPF